MPAFSLEDDAAILRGGWDDRTLADMLFMSISTLRERRRELTRPPAEPAEPISYWTPEEDHVLRTLQAQRVRHKVIARQINRTPGAVKRQVGRLGIARGRA